MVCDRNAGKKREESEYTDGLKNKQRLAERVDLSVHKHLLHEKKVTSAL